MTYYKQYVHDIMDAVENLVATDAEGANMETQVGVERWCQYTRDATERGNCVYLVGNGASAMMASHMAADASKNGGIRAMAFNDVAYLTAVSNDESYEQSFAVPLRRLARKGDVLITISSSGNSPNVIAAITAAREIGLDVVTVSGMSDDNRSRCLGDLNFYAPAETYGLVECSHQVLLHCWLDQYIKLQESNT